MTSDQMIAFGTLLICLVLFIWGKFRYDLVAILGMLIVVITGVIPPEQAFYGFAHPAVITVAAVLVISQTIKDSGAVDTLIRIITPFAKKPFIHVAFLTSLVTAISGFINNVGALAILMPVAIKTARKHKQSPGMVLMPLSFGSILGGLITLIGTPPNIIVSAYRQEVTGVPFYMFDYAHVGLWVAVAGVLFVSLIGWRLLPKREMAVNEGSGEFKIENYITELRIPEKSSVIGSTIADLEAKGHTQPIVSAILRKGRNNVTPAPDEKLLQDDILLIQADQTDIRILISKTGLERTNKKKVYESLSHSKDAILAECILTGNSQLVGRTLAYLKDRSTNINLLAIARNGEPIKRRLYKEKFVDGDVLLLQGESSHLYGAMEELSCLPLAHRDLKLRKTSNALITLGIFGIGLVAMIMGYVSITIAFTSVIFFYVITKQLPASKLYSAINWPVIILLGAMISVGQALEITGGTELIANKIVSFADVMPPSFLLLLVFVVTMTLSDVINNAATAVIMAPISLHIAGVLDVNQDTFLMAVAIGASCAFLTPIGHQSNTLVMGPGGYKFGDYWKMGLPLEALIVLVAIPLLLKAWPL